MTLLAPNGNPSNLNPQQWALVRTPEFKAWFGDWEKLAYAKLKDPAMDDVTLENLSKDVSKVVDSNGEPLVVWHFSKRLKSPLDKFYVFNVNKQLGAHFGSLKQTESIPYQPNAEEYNYLTEGEKFRVSRGYYAKTKSPTSFRYYQVFLNIRNPIRAKDTEFWENDYLLKLLDSKFTNLIDENFIGESAKQLAIKNKIDGIVYLNRFENELPIISDEYDAVDDDELKKILPTLEDSWIAFNPNQIKLADGTNTTFDGNNPDIRYDDGGEIDAPDEFYGERGVGALIYCTTTNRFLLLHRGIHVQEPNTWGMVSGKVDDDDSHLEYAISREVEEELDVVLNAFTPTYIFRKGDFTFHNYFAFVDEEFEPRLNWENEGYMWVSINEFPDNLHFGLKILMDKVDLTTFQPKEEFANGGSVQRDVYTGKQIKKVYVSIRIKYEIERQTAFGGKFGNYEISSIDEKPFIELQNGVLEGVLGVSASSYNLSEWLVHRECLIMMPFDEFLKFNNTEQVQYYDAYYLTKDGLKPFFRLYDRKGTGEQEYYSVVQTILPKIALELELESMVDSDLANDFYIIKSWFDVYNSSAFLKYVASQPRINRPEDFVKYTIEFWKSGEAEKQYYYGRMPTKISEEDIIPAVMRGIVNAGKIYDTESEWLMLDKRLVVPEGSILFFVQKGYDNLKTEYEKLISRYNLRSKYKINYIKQKELDELQSEKFNLKDKEFQEFLNKSRSEVDRKIAKAYKKAEDEIIENWTDKLRVELTEYFDNREFSDDDGNRYGTDIFEVPSVATYYDSLMLKFIELYEGQADMFLKTKNKWILSDVLNSYRDYLNALNDSEGSDYLEVYTDYAKVYKYNIIEKLRYLVIYEYDINKFGSMIKKEVGSDLYRYFQKDEIRLKVGGLA